MEVKCLFDERKRNFERAIDDNVLMIPTLFAVCSFTIYVATISLTTRCKWSERLGTLHNPIGKMF